MYGIWLSLYMILQSSTKRLIQRRYLYSSSWGKGDDLIFCSSPDHVGIFMVIMIAT